MSRLLTGRGRFSPLLIGLLVFVCLSASLLNVALAWLPSQLVRSEALLARLIADSPLCLAQHAAGPANADESQVLTSSAQQLSKVSFDKKLAESGDAGVPHCDACLFTFAMLRANHYFAQAPPASESPYAFVAAVFHPSVPRFSLPMSQAPPDFPPIV